MKILMVGCRRRRVRTAPALSLIHSTSRSFRSSSTFATLMPNISMVFPFGWWPWYSPSNAPQCRHLNVTTGGGLRTWRTSQ